MSTSPKKVEHFIHESEPESFYAYFKTLLMWLSVFLITPIVSTSILILFPFVYPFDRERHSLHFLSIIWAKLIIKANPWWKFHIEGAENLPPKNQAVVYVANHQSQADILALLMLGTRFRWLAKNSLFKIPIFGWGMSAVGYVPVKRGNKTSSEKCIRKSAAHIKKGTSMAFFPEGTRSKNGELGCFKNGAFKLATSSNVPVVPITIQGCSKLLPKGSFVPKKAEVRITIHQPILPKKLTPEELMLEAKELIAKELNKEKK